MEHSECMDIDLSDDSSSQSENGIRECVIDDYVYVDLVGFNNRQHFICKEFSLIDGDFKYHAIIKPPYSIHKFPLHERQMTIWEINHLHGLKYDGGDVHLIDVLQSTYQRLASKKVILENNYKIQSLKYMYRNCVDLTCLNIEDLGFDMDLQSEDPYPTCKKHGKILGEVACECAFATTLRLKEIAENNFKLLNVI